MKTTIVRNGLVAVLVGMVFWLSFQPYLAQARVKKTLGIRENVYILSPDRRSNASLPENIDMNTAQTALNALITENRLAFKSQGFGEGDKPDLQYVSANIADFGILELVEGDIDPQTAAPGTLLAQAGSGYGVGDTIMDDQPIAATVIARQLAYGFGDTVMFSVIESLSQLSPKRHKGNYYLQTTDTEELARVQAYIETLTQRPYTAETIYSYLAGDAMEMYQQRVQRLAVLFLLFCLGLLIFSDLNYSWYKQRETYRIERMMGRSRGYFLRRWFGFSVRQWLVGVMVATLGFVLYSLRLQSLAVHGPLLLAYTMGIVVVGLAMTYGLTRSASRFPLGRKSLDQRTTWHSLVVPLFITLTTTLGTTYLFATTLVQWRETRQAIATLGANTVVATTTATSKTILPRDMCQTLEATLQSKVASDVATYNVATGDAQDRSLVSCGWFGLIGTEMWPTEFSDYSYRFMSGLEIGVDDAETLGISLVAGRFPKDTIPEEGEIAEVAINEEALAVLADERPDIGLGSIIINDTCEEYVDASKLKIVGISRMLPITRFELFDSMYEPFTLLNFHLPDFYYLGETGGATGLRLVLPSAEMLPLVKQTLRDINRDVEFIVPSEYAQIVAKILQQSLYRQVLIFVLATVFVFLVYQNFINTMLAKRRLDMSIWRLLGMSIRRLQKRLSGYILPIPLVAGVAGLGVGALLLFLQDRTDVLIPAVLIGGMMVVVLAVGCGVLLYVRTRPLYSQEISQTYREAL